MTTQIEEIKKEIATKKETTARYGKTSMGLYYLDLVKDLELELAELESNQVEEVNEEIAEATYTKFEAGKTYQLRLSSQAHEFRYFECTGIKEGKVKGSFNGKPEKWYDIILTRKFINGKLTNDIECEALQPDKRVSNYVKANEIK